MVVCLLLKLVIQNYILSSWIFDQTELEILEQMRGSGWETAHDWEVFDIWMTIE